MSEDSIEQAIRASVKFPFTARGKLAYRYREGLDKAWQNKKKCDVLEKQLKAVDSIKQHIAERKREFLCHQHERLKEKLQQKEQLNKDILQKYKFNLRNEETRKKIASKLLIYNNAQKKKILGQKERMMNIIQKISTEYEEKEKEKIMKKVTKTISQPISTYLQLEDEFLEEEAWEDIEAPVKEKAESETKSSKRSKGSKTKEKKEKKTKQGKKPKEKKKKEKKEKTGKGSKDKMTKEFVMPVIPITNPREKIKDDLDTKIPAMLETLPDYEKFLTEETEYYRKLKETFPDETKFSWEPPSIQFLEFENDKKYKQKLTIYNGSRHTKYCRYYEIKSNDDFSSVNIQVEETGTHKLTPSNNFSLTVYFTPKNVTLLEGNLIFITRITDQPEVKKIAIPFRCEKATININIIPTNVVFKTIPIWKTEKNSNKTYKTLQIKNRMNQECILVIRKVKPISADDEELADENEEKKSEKEENIKEEEESISVALLLNTFFEKMSNIFQFESYYYTILPKSTINLKIFYDNLSYVGAYLETFELEFLKKENNIFQILKTEFVFVQIEVTGKFILTDTEYLDYNICVLNSVYQQRFTVFNYGIKPYTIGFQFPSKLKQYLSAYPQTFFLKPNGSACVSLRFIPRKEILTSGVIYFDSYTSTLNCPIKVCILSSEPLGIPPTILSIFALLTRPDNINIITENYLYENGYPVIQLGNVTTHESVITEFELENSTAVKQEFAFLNLPEAITIFPDYGFGSVNFDSSKVLKICLSPTIFDMVTNDQRPTSNSIEVSYKIYCTTMYKLGGLREEKKKQIKEKTLEEIKSAFINIGELFADDIKPNYSQDGPIQSLQSELTLEEMQINEEESQKEGYSLIDGMKMNEMFYDEFEEEEEGKEIVKKKLALVVKATILNYWTELSHQFVIFPDTPLGSYSTMTILFSAINHNSFDECVCGFIKKDKTVFDCHFEVTGGCEEITIEPICGDLKKGESVHLLLIAKPKVKNHILYETARVYKFTKILAEKEAKAKEKKKPGGKKKKPEAKKQKKKDKKSKASDTSEDRGKIPLKIPEVLSLHNCDYYPAEKEIWKSMKPYSIKTKFIFTVTFPEHFNKQNETLYLTAKCRVIQPEFVTNLTTQSIDFGPVIINTRPKKIFQIENISKKFYLPGRIIFPKVSPLRPFGPFICSTQLIQGLEKEHLLKIPITFAPTEEKFYQEYFEIKSGNTIETLMVTGEGIPEKFEFAPSFTVSRITAKIGKSGRCEFQINNKSTAPLFLSFVKTCELYGSVIPKPIVKTEVDEKGEGKDKGKGKGKGKDKDKGKGKSPKSAKSAKSRKPQKFSTELTEDEQYSIETNFHHYTEPSQFRIMNAENNTVIIEPSAKSKVRIIFETPKLPTPDAKHDKHKKRLDTAATVHAKDVSYLAKYNIMLDKILLVKDIILLAQFKK